MAESLCITNCDIIFNAPLLFKFKQFARESGTTQFFSIVQSSCHLGVVRAAKTPYPSIWFVCYLQDAFHSDTISTLTLNWILKIRHNDKNNVPSFRKFHKVKTHFVSSTNYFSHPTLNKASPINNQFPVHNNISIRIFNFDEHLFYVFVGAPKYFA